MQEETDIRFNFKTNSPSIIKVIGVGGGGGNAVNHMYKEGIHDVSFVLCNTDNQALSDSPIPTRLQLGTEGLGAGNRPERARQAAMESLDGIKEMLNDGTRMVFITAGRRYRNRCGSRDSAMCQGNGYPDGRYRDYTVPF